MKILKRLVIIVRFLFFFSFISPLVAQTTLMSPSDILSPETSKNGMIVTSDPIATKTGLEILKQGGNAIDAAVTIGFVMAVTYPRAGNIGGGGFMLIYSANNKKVIALDYRETAPQKAYKNMFMDKNGRINSNLKHFSHLSAGVPGTVAGLALALEKYGTLPLAEVLAPAIKLAEEGFMVSPALSKMMADNAIRLGSNSRFISTQKIFFKSNGNTYKPGDIFIQKDLAKTLKAIAEKGIEAFYKGEIADLIVKDMEMNDGLITKTDLANYQPIFRQPIHSTYRGYDVYSMSPPSSGGVHIIQILNMLEEYDIGSLGHNSIESIHLMGEAMKRAFADRSRYLGDPDFVKIPITGLLSKEYAAQLRTQIDHFEATPSQDILPSTPPGYESNETTHYSVVDKEGNAVSNTYTLNFSFGSGIVVPGAGFLLNNEMDDFSVKPGTPNAYGLISSRANGIEPRKRMLSSMSPTIVLKEGRPFLITGSPGGSQITTTILQVIMNVIDHQMSIQEAVKAIRIHHQWLPDELRYEEGLNPEVIKQLTEMGHKMVLKRSIGTAQSIFIDQEQGLIYGAADPRRVGLALGY